jgi:2,4-dienoyl-CoA reductase-like NADH-dependent reductase (Old Yellow Enzyme family)
MLFTSGDIGTLTLPNRLVRSATAECLADPDGRPRTEMVRLYQELARGGVGLIISGHMYVHPSGKAHSEMTGIYADDLISALAQLTHAVHREGGRVAAQINHGGMHANAPSVSEPMAPAAIEGSFLTRPAREITPAEIETMIEAYAQAARRAQEAGFDAVQIHAAHGYLISQFLSPFVNRRSDEWGEDQEGRMRFLREVCAAVRQEVGEEYPVFVKLGMKDGAEGGLTAQEGARVVAALEGFGLDAVEISSGVEGDQDLGLSIRSGIRRPEDEAYFRPPARQARAQTNLPILLVGGLRSRDVMEDVLSSGDADFISLSRPLICEPDLPERLRKGIQERSSCISGNLCWPKEEGTGIACRCPIPERQGIK